MLTMVLPKSLALIVLLLSLTGVLSSPPAQVQTQVYVKARAASRLMTGVGVKIAQTSSPSTTPSRCAALCQLRGCQSFEFGRDDASPVCRIYKNVAPKLNDMYLVNTTDYDYYEVSLLLPPQDYARCDAGPGCRPGAFCGKVVKRAPCPGQAYYTLAVHTACYAVFLNASEALNWTWSRAACVLGGGKLVEPANWNEQQLLVSLMGRMTSNPNYLQPAAPAPTTVWLGCSGKAKDWKWQDGSNVTNTFWHGTNPDGARDVNCCATFYTNPADTSFWIDRNCADGIARVCTYDFPA